MQVKFILAKAEENYRVCNILPLYGIWRHYSPRRHRVHREKIFIFTICKTFFVNYPRTKDLSERGSLLLPLLLFKND